MYNWDYPKTKKIKKDEIWHLERLINYGLGKEKISKEILKRNFNKIKISKATRAFLELLLWNKRY